MGAFARDTTIFLYSLVLARLHLLHDPTSFEEPLIDATLTIAVDEQGQVCALQQDGLLQVGAHTGEQVIKDCIAAATKRRAQIQIPS